MTDWVPLTLDRITAHAAGSILEEANQCVLQMAKALADEEVTDTASVKCIRFDPPAVGE
jgi:hypothetical protein